MIDAKKYIGAIEVRDVGRQFHVDERLYVNGRDRSALVDGVLWQVDVVRTALGEEFGSIPIRGVLCFVWGRVGLDQEAKARQRSHFPLADGFA